LFLILDFLDRDYEGVLDTKNGISRFIRVVFEIESAVITLSARELREAVVFEMNLRD
jgi:hypothetical protein